MINPTLTINISTDEIDETYSPEFMEEYGITDLNNLGSDWGGDSTLQLTFSSEENKETFITTFDIP